MIDTNIISHFRSQQESLEELLQFEDSIPEKEFELLKKAIECFEEITGKGCDYDFWRINQ